MFKTENYYHIDYLGEAGITEKCLFSLHNLIQTHADLSYALLFTRALLHKGLKGIATLIELNSSGNLGMRAT